MCETQGWLASIINHHIPFRGSKEVFGGLEVKGFWKGLEGFGRVWKGLQGFTG